MILSLSRRARPWHLQYLLITRTTLNTILTCYPQGDWGIYRSNKTGSPGCDGPMMTISNISRICALLRGGSLGLDTNRDLEMVLEIGRRQESGLPITQKQLCHSGIAPAATIRRRLRILVAKKVIKKTINTNDGRSVILSLSDVAIRQLRQVSRSIKQMDW